MALKEKFFAMLASLDESDKQRIQAALAAAPSAPQTAPPTDPPEDVTPEVATPAQSDAEDVDEAKMGEAAAPEGDAVAEPPAQSADETEADVTTTEDAEADEAGAPAEPAAEPESPPPAPVQDTDDDMPVDYQQIVDGLNAKILALEAENASLKAKTEGAFGLTSRPGEPVKVRSLYDDTSDIHFKK